MATNQPSPQAVAACHLVAIALQSPDWEMRGAQTTGGGPRPWEHIPDPADYDIAPPTSEQIIAVRRKTVMPVESEIQEALFAANAAAEQLMHEYARTLPEDEQPGESNVCGVCWHMARTDTAEPATERGLLEWLGVDVDDLASCPDPRDIGETE